MNKIAKTSLRNVLLAGIYIFGVSQIMNNGDTLFGHEDKWLTPFVVLLLFSLSAAVVGGLIFGQAVMLFLDKKRSESVKAAIYSVLWLAILTVLAIFALALIK